MHDLGERGKSDRDRWGRDDVRGLGEHSARWLSVEASRLRVRLSQWSVGVRRLRVGVSRLRVEAIRSILVAVRSLWNN